MAVDLEESILQDILRVVMIYDHAPDMPVQGLIILVYDLFVLHAARFLQ
jgi:hypothetical protein